MLTLRARLLNIWSALYGVASEAVRDELRSALEDVGDLEDAMAKSKVTKTAWVRTRGEFVYIRATQHGYAYPVFSVKAWDHLFGDLPPTTWTEVRRPEAVKRRRDGTMKPNRTPRKAKKARPDSQAAKDYARVFGKKAKAQQRKPRGRRG